MASNGVLVIPALGRNFTVGMFYNAQTDELIPGAKFWVNKTLEENTVVSSFNGSDFHITTSDSIESRFSLLEVDSSLRASVMCGLTEVGRSARYLNDKKKFHSQSRVTSQYKTTTTFKQLSLTALDAKKLEQMDPVVKASATHVVTGILHGINCFFVFDSEKLETSNVQDIQGQMEAVIKKIPSFYDQGKMNIKLTAEEKALTDTLSCKVYGDSVAVNNPTTFETAVSAYVQIIQQVQQYPSRVVPLKVHLMPLKSLNSGAAEIKTGISAALVRRAEEALEDLQQVEKSCNDCLEDKIAKTFPQLNKKLNSFQTLCKFYRSELQKQMALKVPLIRAGVEDEGFIKQMFHNRHQSPFSQENLSRWIEDKEKEINVIRSCTEIMKGIKIISDQSELDRALLSPGADDALCFVFTSLNSSEPYLQQMANYVDSPDVESPAKSWSEDQWYFSDKVILKMREKAKLIHDLAKALNNSSRISFLVTASANEKHTGANLYHYQNGVLRSDDFSPPRITDVEKETKRWDLTWYACDLTLDPDSAYDCLILSDEHKRKVTHGAGQSYPDLPERFDHLPQVLCKEGLTGRHYWEVEWSTGKGVDAAVGVCYNGLYRKGDGDECRLGWNAMSWCLRFTWYAEQPGLKAEHEKQLHDVPFPAAGCSRLGLYLDCPSGTLSYYKVSGVSLTHLRHIYGACLPSVHDRV